MSELIGKMIGGFRILAEIKSGGQGQIFKGVCDNPPFDGIEPGTVVALKVMPTHDENGSVRAEMEKRTGELARLSHPNIVEYYGCFYERGFFNDIYVIVQEWLEGETLKQRLARNPHGLDADEALRVTDAVLAGLEYTAASGIVHRNVKPGNIFLCSDGGVKLIDFEDAYQMGDTITLESGNLVGSFDYMAPDFMNSTFHGDERSDIFSMGVVMHETITGCTPYQRIEGKSGLAADFAFLTRWARLNVDGTNPIKISSHANRLLVHSDEVLAKALSPLPENRYESFAAFRSALKTIHYHDLRNGDKVYRFLQFIDKGVVDNGVFTGTLKGSEVFKARLVESGQVVAIKHLLRAVHEQSFCHEVKILAQLHDSCFVRFIDFFDVDDVGGGEAFLVMDFLPGMPGSSLHDAIKRAGGASLPLRETLLAFARFANGLSILHSQGIIHRDIRPANLYYPEGQPERVAIMGFAIAHDINGGQTSGPVSGALDYMPPEIILTHDRCWPGMDIYALGLCLYEALSGKTAYPRQQGYAASEAFFRRVKINMPPAFDSPIAASRPKLLQLLKDMTNLNPEKRIRDAAEVKRILSELATSEKGEGVSEQPSLHVTGGEDLYIERDDRGAGNVIDRFRILAEIKGGGGGQGRLFKAVCENPPFDGIEPGTVVALKVMPTHDGNGSVRVEMGRRMEALVQLSHPNIVKYYGYFLETGIAGTSLVIVQEFLECETLKQRLARCPNGLDVDEAMRMAEAVSGALEYAVANGIVHRDVRPGNIFMCANGGTKIIGFEDACRICDAKAPNSGHLVETVNYMAPDFMDSGFYGDEPSSIFSMGVVMHEVITGHTPYQDIEGKSGRSDFAFLSRWDKLHMDGTNPIRISSRANRLLANSREVLEKALAPLPENRYKSFAAFRAGLKTICYRDLQSGDKVYRILQFIGRGEVGEVFKARLMESGQIVAIKHLLRSDNVKHFHGEAKIRVRLEGASFVHFIDFFEVGLAGVREAFLVMGFLSGMPGNSLRDAIKRAGGAPLPLRETLLAFARFAHGLSVLHSHGIFHRAIKPSKLYYPEGCPERAVIMDFAWPCEVDSSVCTPPPPPCGWDYVAFEMLSGSQYDVGCDIYALGLSFYEALSGKTAYTRLPTGSAAFAAFYERMKSKTQPTFDSPVVTSRPKLLQLLKDMTNIDPEKRIRDAAEVERRLSDLTATVNEQAPSGAHCLDDAPASAKKDNATKTEERNPDEIPTDDVATLDPASDAETGGWQIEVEGKERVFPVGSTVNIGTVEDSDMPLKRIDGNKLWLRISCDSNFASIANRSCNVDVSVGKTKVSAGQCVSVSCLCAPCEIDVGSNTQMRITPVTSWNIASERFQCGRVIGRGGQSVVFEAVDTTTSIGGKPVGNRIALKVLKGNKSDEDIQRLNALLAKMSSCDRLQRKCLRVYNGNTPTAAIAMKLLHGESLYMRLRRHPHGLDINEAVYIMKELTNRLSALHEKGIIHRDIKPGNVFIDGGVSVELLDFSLAKWDDGALGPLNGQGIGTPQYRAPEMESSDFTGDVQSDIYSAVLVFREMLCGWQAEGYGHRFYQPISDERDNHPKPTMKDREANCCKLASNVDKILERGLAPRGGRYSSCKELLADLENVRFPVYEHDGHHYTRLTYEQCEGCAANGVAYGRVLDKETGQVLKWKTFAVMNPKNERCYYSKGEVRVGLLSRIHDSSLNWGGIAAAFPIRDGNSDLMMLIYVPGKDDPANTPRYQGKTLWGLTLRVRGGEHTNVTWAVKQVPVADALLAFARYARALSILHGAGVKTLDLAPDILMYEDGKPNSAAITCRRYGCWCDGGAGVGPSEVTWKRWCGVWKVWEECYRSFYRLPNGDVCDAFALGLCLYETITGQRGYSNPCRYDPYRGERGNIIHKGSLSVDLDRPVLAKYADVADVIRRLTDVDERRRLKDMDKIEDLLRNLAVKYRLKGGEDAVNESGPFAPITLGEAVNVERGCSKMTFSLFNAERGCFGDDYNQPTGRDNSRSLFKNMLARFRNMLKRFKVKTISPSFDCKVTPFRHLVIPSIGNLDADQETPCSICDVREHPEPLS